MSSGAWIYEVNRRIVLRAAGGEQGGSFEVSSFHGLVEVLQPIAVPVYVEDMGLVKGRAFGSPLARSLGLLVEPSCHLVKVETAFY